MSTYLPYELLRDQNWTGTNFDTFTQQGPYQFTADSDGSGAGTAKATIPTNVVKGLVYIISFTSTINSGSGTMTVALTDASGTAISNTPTFSSSGAQSVTLTATKTDASGLIQISTPESSTINITISGITARYRQNISPSSATLTAKTLAGSSTSPFTGQQQIYAHRGQFWALELSFPPMPVGYAKLWRTWFMNQNGLENSFYYRPILESTSSGVITAADGLDINGAQAAQSTDLDITGPLSTNSLLEVGDFLECNTQLIQVRGGTLDSDGSGNLTINIWPYVRDAISDTTTVYHQGPRGLFRLEHSDFSYQQSMPGIIDGFTIVSREAF